MEKSVLVTLADKNYVEQAKQLFSSAYHNAKWKGDFCLLSYGIPKKELKWFEKRGIYIKECEEGSERNIYKYPKTVLCKFHLFTKFFKKWKKVVFFDSDIIIRYPIKKLQKTNNFAAVPQSTFLERLKQLRFQFIEPEKSSPRRKEIFDRLKKRYNLKKTSFNAGVLSFDTRIIDESSFYDLKKLFEEYSGIVMFPEQAIFNLYFYRDWKKLSQMYNYRVNFFKKMNVPVLHFAGLEKNNKPWEKDNPYYLEWVENLKKAESTYFKKSSKTRRNSSCFFLFLQSTCIGFVYFFVSLKKGFHFFLGKTGEIIYKKNPALYKQIKKFKSSFKL